MRRLTSPIEGSWLSAYVGLMTTWFRSRILSACKFERIDAETIKSVILDILVRMNLAMQKCAGETYDGCSTMARCKGGVAAMIKKIEPWALFTPCYGHALNLACANTIKQCKVVKKALETTMKYQSWLNVLQNKTCNCRL